MSIREREGLIARVRQLRRAGAATDAGSATAVRPAPAPADIESLERRIDELEQMVQGLQDSVHRESERMTKRVGELEARTQPAVLGAALSKDARERGL